MDFPTSMSAEHAFLYAAPSETICTVTNLICIPERIRRFANP